MTGGPTCASSPPGHRRCSLGNIDRVNGMSTLSTDYEAAWLEWKSSGDADLWDYVAGDGCDD